MAQALEGKPTKQTAPNIDRAIERLERYGDFLEKMLAERKLSKVIKAITND